MDMMLIACVNMFSCIEFVVCSCLHDATPESLAALTLIISPMLYFANTLHASMTLWRGYDVPKFDAAPLCLEKSSVRKCIFLCLSDVFSMFSVGIR